MRIDIPFYIQIIILFKIKLLNHSNFYYKILLKIICATIEIYSNLLILIHT